MSLAGKKIVITGGAGILGQGVARVAQEQGAEVILLDVLPSQGELTGKLFQVDLTNSDAVAACFD
jgi:nucleoside-diphosphate-sugar epimerase